MRILLVEDESKVGNALCEGLRAEGYEVVWAQTGEDGFYQASSCAFDLLLLDVMLPGRDGIEILGTLRKQGLHVPVLLLTAKDAIEDRVSGLDAGADDYSGGPNEAGVMCIRTAEKSDQVILCDGRKFHLRARSIRTSATIRTNPQIHIQPLLLPCIPMLYPFTKSPHGSAGESGTLWFNSSD